MTEHETLSKPELTKTETDAASAGTTSPFDAVALFNQHKKNIVRVSDKVTFSGNVLDTTVGSGFAIDYLPGPEKDGSKDDTEAACRFATDNHVVTHTSKDATVELGNGNRYD